MICNVKSNAKKDKHNLKNLSFHPNIKPHKATNNNVN